MDISRITGFIAAPFTPMEADGSVLYSLVPEYARRLKTAGVSGVFICGTTGESLSLTKEERMKLAETWMTSQGPDFSILVHVGCDSLVEAQSLASHAQEIGANGVGAMPPVFFKPGLEELTVLLRLLAKSCEPLPFYYYHIPSMTGVNHSMLELNRICSEQIPNYRGIKYTHNDLLEYSLLNQYQEGRYDILYGRDETLLAALPLGARGMIGSTYNYAMSVYKPLLEAFQSGRMDSARRMQVISQRIVQILVRHGGGTVVGKALMRIAGLDLGPCRLPNRQIQDQELAVIREELTQAGVLEYIGL